MLCICQYLIYLFSNTKMLFLNKIILSMFTIRENIYIFFLKRPIFTVFTSRCVYICELLIYFKIVLNSYCNSRI